MILLKYATRSRPRIFQETLSLWIDLLSGKHDYRFVISCDADDATMNNDGMRQWVARLPTCELHFNPPPQTKITAINANMDGQAFDLFVNVSDDMFPQEKGYDDRIVSLFNFHFPDGDGVLHLNDGRVGRKLNTLPIFDQKYYRRFNYVYAPQYKNLWVDNEFQAVSESLGRAAYVDEVIIRHQWIGEHPDDLHRRNEADYEADAATFERRRGAGFPI